MNLEQLLGQEREGIAPNPMIQRMDAIVATVRRRRRARAAAAAVGLVVLAILPVVAANCFGLRLTSSPRGRPRVPP